MLRQTRVGAGAWQRNLPVPPRLAITLGPVGIALRATNGQAVAQLSGLEGLMPELFAVPLSRTFHVDPVAGNNANSALGAYPGDYALAVRDYVTALGKANATGLPSQIRIKSDSNPVFTRATGGALTFPTVPLAVLGEGTGRPQFTGGDAHAWALDGVYTTCYSAAEANCSGVIDMLNQRWLGENAGGRLLDRNGVGRQAYIELVQYATPALLDAAVLAGVGGGYCNSGGKTYLKRGDGAVVTDLNTRSLRGTATAAPAFSTQLTAATATNNNLYIQNCDFYGGFQSNNAGTRNIWLRDCRAFYAGLNAGGNGNAFALDHTGNVAFTHCEGWSTGTDIFNLHGTNGALQAFSHECLGWDMGRSPGQSCNGHTAHETVTAIDLLGDYQLGHGGNCAYINSAKVLLFGTRSLGDLGDIGQGGSKVPSAILLQDTAQCSVYYCTLSSSQRALYTPDNNSAIFTLRNNILAGTVLGNVQSVGQ